MIGSVVGEHGGPLLDHSGHALLLVVGIEQKGELGGLLSLAGGDGLNGGLVDGGLGSGQSAGRLAHQLPGHIHSLGVDGVILRLGSGGLSRFGRGLGSGNRLLRTADLGGFDSGLGLLGGSVQGGVTQFSRPRS